MAVILDEAGGPVLDEAQAAIYDEAGPGPVQTWITGRARLTWAAGMARNT